MYPPKSFKKTNLEQLHQFIEQYNFATLISTSNNHITTTHIPTMLHRDQGKYGTLSWHIANQNAHSTAFDGTMNALLIFHGPHAYISPAWYKNAPAVPTWNYAVVRVQGHPKVISKNQLAYDLTKMIDQHELISNKITHYHIPDEYKLKLLEHITGFHMEITQIEGTFKLGQNRSTEDQQGMLYGLRNQNTNDTIALADFIESIKS